MPEDLRSIAQTVSRMLRAVPHLFPPTTIRTEGRTAEDSGATADLAELRWLL
jgi:hypothetical protein